MFSQQVVETDKFLDLPATTQLLYFHLGMFGDDDGFVASPKKIMRSIGSSLNDLKGLIDSGYIITFDSGVIVITDWRINNTLRNDRYRESLFFREKSMICEDLTKKYVPINNADTVGIPNEPQTGYQSAPQLNSTEQNEYIPHQSRLMDADFDEFWKVYPRKLCKAQARKAFKKISGVSIDTITSAVSRQMETEQWQREGGKFIPYPSTWLNRGQWEDEVKSNNQEPQESATDGLTKVFNPDLGVFEWIRT